MSDTIKPSLINLIDLQHVYNQLSVLWRRRVELSGCFPGQGSKGFLSIHWAGNLLLIFSTWHEDRTGTMYRFRGSLMIPLRKNQLMYFCTANVYELKNRKNNSISSINEASAILIFMFWTYNSWYIFSLLHNRSNRRKIHDLFLFVKPILLSDNLQREVVLVRLTTCCLGDIDLVIPCATTRMGDVVRSRGPQ